MTRGYTDLYITSVPALHILGQPLPLYMYRQGSPVEIQTQTRWNLIGRTMIARPPVLSPSSILPPPSSHCPFIPVSKISRPVSEMLLFYFVYISENCVSVELRNL